jgi:hypothetical protein
MNGSGQGYAPACTPPPPPQLTLEKCDRYQLYRNVAGPQARFEGRGEDKGSLAPAMNRAIISNAVIAPNCALSFSFINHPRNKLT